MPPVFGGLLMTTTIDHLSNPHHPRDVSTLKRWLSHRGAAIAGVRDCTSAPRDYQRSVYPTRPEKTLTALTVIVRETRVQVCIFVAAIMWVTPD